MRKQSVALVGAVLLSAFSGQMQAQAGSDLAIGVDSKTGRPNVFIAWRNSQRILEVEVEVKNQGTEQGAARLTLAVLDESGNVVASNTRPQDAIQRVELPAAHRGGADGRIVQIKGSLELNLLIDRLDRANAPYLLRAALVPEGADADHANNTTVKVFNLPSRVRAGATHFREFRYRNDTGAPLDVTWMVERKKLPQAWTVRSSFAAGDRTRLSDGQTFDGWLQIAVPALVRDGDSADLVVVARDANTQAVVYQHEWYAVYDHTPPRITDLRCQPDAATGVVEIAATVDDASSMLKEASGVRVEYSTDGGVTFSSRIMAYDAGNFVGPTSFNTRLGPFATRTKVVGRIIAADIADNRVEKDFGPIVIPAATTLPPAAAVRR